MHGVREISNFHSDHKLNRKPAARKIMAKGDNQDRKLIRKCTERLIHITQLVRQ
jgi:hypothetical protein